MYKNNKSRDTKLYDILGVSNDADEVTIKKNYRKKAMKYHPDRNKDNKEESEKKFKELSHAYEILSDKDKRSTYDNFGLDAANNSSSGGGNPFDMFSNIFSQSNGFENMFNSTNSRSSQRRKSPNVVKKLDLNLEDIYCKKSLNINFEKTIICKQCSGSGAKDTSCIKICSTCDGSGRIINIQTFGPGMISQSQSLCHTCNGIGKSITSKCSNCRGAKYDVSQRKVAVKLDHSNKDGDKLLIPGEANENIDCNHCGDLLLQLNIKEHSVFKRKGNNLLITKSVNLVEALCGCDIAFIHLDNRKILVKTGDIINPNTIKKIVGEGFSGGDMIIEFDIVFPTILSKERKEYISKLLPGIDPSIKNYDNYEIKMLENCDSKNDNNDNYNDNNNNNNDNNNEPNLGEEMPVNCAQQ